MAERLIWESNRIRNVTPYPISAVQKPRPEEERCGVDEVSKRRQDELRQEINVESDDKVFGVI